MTIHMINRPRSIRPVFRKPSPRPMPRVQTIPTPTSPLPNGQHLHIPVMISFMEGGNIGQAYNRDIKLLAPGQWCILIDYDVQIINPYWQHICESAIAAVGDKAGFISCYTNRIGNPLQSMPGVDRESDDMMYHQGVALKAWMDNRGKLIDTTDSGGKFSGFFIMTNRAVWERVGMFKEQGFFTVDNDYYDKVRHAGYRTYLMADLYCYHKYKRETTKAPSFPPPSQ